jgi:hypothetical protein
MTTETKKIRSKSQVLDSPEGSEFTNSFQIGLFTSMETYTLTPEMIQLLDHLGSWNALTEINQHSLIQVSTCVRQNVQTIHRWLSTLIESRSTLSYTDAERSTPTITVTNNEFGINTIQNDVLELDFPDGKRMCNVSTIINCLYLLGRLTEENRAYEPFELSDAAVYLLSNGTRLANCLVNHGQWDKGISPNQSFPSTFNESKSQAA